MKSVGRGVGVGVGGGGGGGDITFPYDYGAKCYSTSGMTSVGSPLAQRRKVPVKASANGFHQLKGEFENSLLLQESRHRSEKPSPLKSESRGSGSAKRRKKRKVTSIAAMAEHYLSQKSIKKAASRASGVVHKQRLPLPYKQLHSAGGASLCNFTTSTQNLHHNLLKQIEVESPLLTPNQPGEEQEQEEEDDEDFRSLVVGVDEARHSLDTTKSTAAMLPGAEDCHLAHHPQPPKLPEIRQSIHLSIAEEEPVKAEQIHSIHKSPSERVPRTPVQKQKQK